MYVCIVFCACLRALEMKVVRARDVGGGKSSSFHSGSSATGQAAVTESPGLMAELRERRNNKRWRSSLLAQVRVI